MRDSRKLSPKEKARLERCMNNVKYLSRLSRISDTSKFIMRGQMRMILKLLGSDYPSPVMVADGIDVMRDMWPFKEKRLRKLIDGRPC